MHFPFRKKAAYITVPRACDHSTKTTRLSVHDHRSYHQSYKSSKSNLSHSSLLFCCFWHYRSLFFLGRFFSCFGISSSALSWIKSYLLNCSFYVIIENLKSSVFQLLYGFPQGSVLGPYCLLMILIFSYYYQLWISLIASLTLKTLKLTYQTECLTISCLLILLNLSFSSLICHNNSLNSIILPLIYLTMLHLLILLAILVSSLMVSSHLHNRSLLFLNHASTIFVTQDVFVILLIKLLPAPLLFLLFTLS